MYKRQVYMTEGDVRKARSGQLFPVQGNVVRVSSMSQENMEISILRGLQIIIQSFLDLPGVIAESMDDGSQIGKGNL